MKDIIMENNLNYSKKKNNIGVIFLIISCCFIIILVVTNPDEELHREKVKKYLYSEMNFEKNLLDDMNNDNEWESLGSALGLSLGLSLTDKIVENIVIIDNYVLFSITKIRFDQKEKIIGIGILGNVVFLRKLSN